MVDRKTVANRKTNKQPDTSSRCFVSLFSFIFLVFLFVFYFVFISLDWFFQHFSFSPIKKIDLYLARVGETRNVISFQKILNNFILCLFVCVFVLKQRSVTEGAGLFDQLPVRESGSIATPIGLQGSLGGASSFLGGAKAALGHCFSFPFFFFFPRFFFVFLSWRLQSFNRFLQLRSDPMGFS